MHPKVSVIIPTYNRAHVLSRAIESVLTQTEKSLEIIVVDDGSSDETEALMKQYVGETVRYVKTPENGGPSKARNLGAELAIGDYIAFQDSDDEWTPDKLEKQLALFEKDGEKPGMVYCCFLKKFPDKEVLYPPMDMPMEMKNGDIFPTLLMRPLVGTPTMLIPREIWKEMGGLREELKCFEDWEFSMRVAEKYPVLLVNEPLHIAYASGESAVTESKEAIKAEFFMFREFFSYFNADDLRKQKLDSITKKVRTVEDFEEYRRGIKEVLGVEL